MKSCLLCHLAFATSVRLALHLPRPTLTVLSTPYAHLSDHLRRHGLHNEAANFDKAKGITPEYILHAWVQTVEGGREGLLSETRTILCVHGHIAMQQFSMATAETKEFQSSRASLPSEIHIPHLGNDSIQRNCGATHVLAVCGTSGDRCHSTDSSPPGVMIPCHALIYVLQCASLPAFPTVEADTVSLKKYLRKLLIVPLRIPRPKSFHVTHRFLYLGDQEKLLCDLLPMKHIAGYWDQVRRQALHQASRKPASDVGVLSQQLLPWPSMLFLLCRRKRCSAFAIKFMLPGPMEWPSVSWTHATVLR